MGLSLNWTTHHLLFKVKKIMYNDSTFNQWPSFWLLSPEFINGPTYLGYPYLGNPKLKVQSII